MNDPVSEPAHAVTPPEPVPVVLVAAPEEAIYLLMKSFLRSGDQVIVLTPSYQSLSELAASMGCKIQNWHLELGKEGWELDLDKLQEILNEIHLYN